MHVIRSIACAAALAAFAAGCTQSDDMSDNGARTPSEQMSADLYRTGENQLRGVDTTNFDLLR